MSLLSFMNKIDNIRILILNGVNLGQLGTREIDIYGSISFEEYLNELQSKYPELEISYAQYDSEGDLASALKEGNQYHGVILNAGAYTHTSIILADAIKSIITPVIEVHISNLFGREQYRRESMVSSACIGFISGFGLDSYRLAIEAIKEKIAHG